MTGRPTGWASEAGSDGTATGTSAGHWLLRERRAGDRRVLYLATLAVLCAIGAVVLLANGQRNLHRLLGAAPARATLSAKVPPVVAVAEERPVEIRHLPPRYFSTQDMAAFATFIRLSSLPAQNLCRFLAEMGLRNAGWRASELDPRSHECPSELRLFSAAPGGGFDTAFADVKGDAAGRILRLRFKVSARDATNRAILDARLAAILDFVATQSGWPDLTGLGDKVLATGDFDVESHGLRIRRQQERLFPESYNLIVAPAFETPAARNAYRYFLPTRGLLPQATGNLTTPEEWHRVVRRSLSPKSGLIGRAGLFGRLFPPPG